MKSIFFQKTLNLIMNFCHIKENRTNSATTFLLVINLCLSMLHTKKTWVYVNLDRITSKSCPWPTFKVQCWWEKDDFFTREFFWGYLMNRIEDITKEFTENKIRRILFRCTYDWQSDLTWTACQNFGHFLENKSH